MTTEYEYELSQRPDYFGEMRNRRPQWNIDRERQQQERAAGVTVERYKSRPENAPPRSGGWPTGFAGTGWLVRENESGEILYASAWRRECLEFVAARAFGIDA